MVQTSMGDSRFFARSGPYPLATIANTANGIAPEVDLLVTGVAPLQTAGLDEVSFLNNRRYASALEKTSAGAVIVHPDMLGRVPIQRCRSSRLSLMQDGRGWLRSFIPRRLFARAFIHQRLLVSEGARVDPSAEIEKTGDDKYRIMMAVAGFGEDDIEITAQENLLVVSGNLGEPREAGTTYLYRGITTRAFERRFSLADHVKVVGATLADGVLQVDLERELPEAMKPRRIAVESKPGSGKMLIDAKKVVEGKKAA